MLLDTHAVVWWFEGNPALSADARRAIDRGGERVVVSAVSIFEIANKHRIGKWPEVGALLRDWRSLIDGQRFELLPITAEHADVAGSLAWPHKDPFDRLLVAQSLVEGMTLVPNEKAFEQAGVVRVW